MGASAESMSASWLLSRTGGAEGFKGFEAELAGRAGWWVGWRAVANTCKVALFVPDDEESWPDGRDWVQGALWRRGGLRV